MIVTEKAPIIGDCDGLKTGHANFLAFVTEKAPIIGDCDRLPEFEAPRPVPELQKRHR